MLPASTSLGPVTLRVSDIQRSTEFYRSALRLHRLASTANTILLGGNAPLVELVELPEARARPLATTGLYHVALLMPERVHLAKSLQRLLELGVPLQGAADHLVSEAIYLADPDGIGIELYADRPRSAWPYRGGKLHMSTEPLDVSDLLSTLARGSDVSGDEHSGIRVGHIHLQVADLEASRRFYCDVVGFDLVTTYGRQALFVSAGGYHHHIGLNTWTSTGGRPAPAGSVGLDHYTIQIPRREIAPLRQRCEAAGVPLSGNGDSLTAVDPSGIRIEFIIATA